MHLNFNNNKSPGKDGLTKESYEAFWTEVKEQFIKSLLLYKGMLL